MVADISEGFEPLSKKFLTTPLNNIPLGINFLGQHNKCDFNEIFIFVDSVITEAFSDRTWNYNTNYYSSYHNSMDRAMNDTQREKS